MNYLKRVKIVFFKRLAKYLGSQILLYHSCYRNIPPQLNFNLHNVNPDVMYEQLKWYKKNYQIVSLNEWFESKNKKNLAAVTFDDAYVSVFEEGLQILDTLDIPATIYIIAGNLEGKIFWRDKIRYIYTLHLENQFKEYIFNKYNITGINESLYDISKNKNFIKLLPNRLFNDELDIFIKINGYQKGLVNHCINQPDQLIKHPLITYGNHSYSHYILSTLSKSEQEKDLMKSHQLIKECTLDKYVQYFSTPFGGYDTFNFDTLNILKNLGIKGMLLSKMMIHDSKILPQYNGISFANRFMVPESQKEFNENISKMSRRYFNKEENRLMLKIRSLNKEMDK